MHNYKRQEKVTLLSLDGATYKHARACKGKGKGKGSKGKGKGKGKGSNLIKVVRQLIKSYKTVPCGLLPHPSPLLTYVASQFL